MRRKIEEKLLTWKNKTENRMPLLLYGARQVGKTYILTKFGETQYDNTVYINLETNLSVASYFSNDISPERLIRFLETTVNDVITPGRTLIIFDEIQSCERALTSLKYFCEMAPEYHIAAAGSLLGVAIHREHYSFPVGKVESMTLYPLDFEEFLWANGKKRLSLEIRSAFDLVTPLPKALHQKAIEFYRYYLIVGGMPACVQTFTNSGKLVLVPTIQNEIANNYVANMAKYATTSDIDKASLSTLPVLRISYQHHRSYTYSHVYTAQSQCISSNLQKKDVLCQEPCPLRSRNAYGRDSGPVHWAHSPAPSQHQGSFSWYLPLYNQFHSKPGNGTYPNSSLQSNISYTGHIILTPFILHD